MDHVTAARNLGRKDVPNPPDPDTIEALINAAFWASLRREEGYAPSISLAFLPPDCSGRPLRFEEPMTLAPHSLARLAPAVKRAGIHLGVWQGSDDLCVWGTTRTIPAYCFVLEVIAPGLLVVKHPRGEESGKYVNVAVLEGDDVKVLHQRATREPYPRALLTSLLGFDAPETAGDSVNVLVDLAVSMRAHGRGGSLLVVPAAGDTWRESIVHPIRYSVSPPFPELARLLRATDEERRQTLWQDAFRETIDSIAGLTAVDGATIITDTFELLAFGAKIARRPKRHQVEQVLLTEPVEGIMPGIVHPGQLGGTRHLSAAQFSQDQPESAALVASQDGRFTVFTWSAPEEMVQAHRVEVLLL